MAARRSEFSQLRHGVLVVELRGFEPLTFSLSKRHCHVSSSLGGVRRNLL